MAKKKSGGNPRTIPEGKTQVNFNLDINLNDKVEGIAYQEAVTKSEVLNTAVTKYVEGYEAKNGKVKARQKGKGL
jgi:hypothetical protein